jgi:hypothetical protein
MGRCGEEAREEDDAEMTTEDELDSFGTVGIIGVGRDGRDEVIDAVDRA